MNVIPKRSIGSVKRMARQLGIVSRGQFPAGLGNIPCDKYSCNGWINPSIMNIYNKENILTIYSLFNEVTAIITYVRLPTATSRALFCLYPYSALPHQYDAKIHT